MVRLCRLLLLLAFLAGSPAFAQLDAPQTFAGTAGGTANALTLTIPNVSSLADLVGVPIRFIAASNNASGVVGVTINGTLTANLFKGTLSGATQLLAAGDLIAGQVYTAVLTAAVGGKLIVDLPVGPVVASLRVVTGAYTVGQSGNIDCDTTIVTEGGALYTVTVPAASGFPTGCQVTIKNVDSAGKTVSITGQTNGIFGHNGCGISNLCPGQAVAYLDIGSTWVMVQNPGPWRPTTAPTLYASTTGSNNNDCLSASTPCTLSFVCASRAAIDAGPQAYNAGILTLQLADGTYTASSGQAVCSITGNFGSSAPWLTLLQGDCGNPTGVIIQAPGSGEAIFTKDLGETQIRCMLFDGVGTLNVLVSGAQFSVVDILDNVTFNCAGTSGIDISMSQSASMNIVDSFTKAGPCGGESAIIFLQSFGNLLASSLNPTLTINGGNVTVSTFMENDGGHFEIGNLRFSNSVTVTGTRFTSANAANGQGGNDGGCVHTGGVKIVAFGIPGSTDAAFPVGSCTDFSVANTVSTLPSCGSGNEGALYEVTDSTTSTRGAIITGGGTNKVLARCNATNFVVQ